MPPERKWEKFGGGPAGGPGGSRRGEVRVTISRKGLIYMNARMYAAFGRPKAVAIYYSHEDDAIALQPAYERFTDHFLVKKKQMGWAIHAASFCRHYKIRVPDTERFIRPDLDNEGNMILNLRETVNVGIERKPKRREK